MESRADNIEFLRIWNLDLNIEYDIKCKENSEKIRAPDSIRNFFSRVSLAFNIMLLLFRL